MKTIQMPKPTQRLAIGLLAVTSVALLGQTGKNFILKPAFAQATHVEAADLNTKIGARCFVYRNGPNPINMTDGTLKAVSDKWIVVTTHNKENTPSETWIPIQNVQQVEFPSKDVL